MKIGKKNIWCKEKGKCELSKTALGDQLYYTRIDDGSVGRLGGIALAGWQCFGWVADGIDSIHWQCPVAVAVLSCIKGLHCHLILGLSGAVLFKIIFAFDVTWKFSSVSIVSTLHCHLPRFYASRSVDH